MDAASIATCQLCGLTIEHRQVGTHANGPHRGELTMEWCHSLAVAPAPTFHCPTGGTGKLDNPSRRHEPKEQPSDG